jgi:hypothetical protein
MGDIVPRKEVERDGVRGFSGVAAGAGLLLLSGLGTVLGIVAGGALAAVGLGMSTSKSDKVAGGVIAGAGIVTVLSKAIGLGGGLLSLGGIGLLAWGGYWLYSFYRKLKARS